MFTGQQAIIITVRQQDLDASNGTPGHTSLDYALKFGAQTQQLIGVSTQADIDDCTPIETYFQPFVDQNGSTITSIPTPTPHYVQTRIKNYLYELDFFSEQKLLAEIELGLKSSPFICTLFRYQ